MKYLDLAIANETIKTLEIKGNDYALVNQRIKAFRMVYPEGTIETQLVSNENGVCVFRAEVMNDKGKLLGTGTAYEKEDSSFINKTSYIENCETSAVGRALGMAGFGIDVSVASAEEVQNKINNQVITQEDADTYEIKFGKYKGKKLKEVYKNDPKYIEWMIQNTQDENLLEIVRLATGMYIPPVEEQKARQELITEIVSLDNLDMETIRDTYNISSLKDLTTEQLRGVYDSLLKD